jgi:hypothetical protein
MGASLLGNRCTVCDSLGFLPEFWHAHTMIAVVVHGPGPLRRRYWLEGGTQEGLQAAMQQLVADHQAATITEAYSWRQHVDTVFQQHGWLQYAH